MIESTLEEILPNMDKLERDTLIETLRDKVGEVQEDIDSGYMKFSRSIQEAYVIELRDILSDYRTMLKEVLDYEDKNRTGRRTSYS